MQAIAEQIILTALERPEMDDDDVLPGRQEDVRDAELDMTCAC
jgi:hypothetical protein